MSLRLMRREDEPAGRRKLPPVRVITTARADVRALDSSANGGAWLELRFAQSNSREARRCHHLRVGRPAKASAQGFVRVGLP
jgi:hypothetical protein